MGTIWLSTLCRLIPPLLPVPAALEQFVRRLGRLSIRCYLVDAFICCFFEHPEGTRIKKGKWGRKVLIKGWLPQYRLSCCQIHLCPLPPISLTNPRTISLCPYLNHYWAMSNDHKAHTKADWWNAFFGPHTISTLLLKLQHHRKMNKPIAPCWNSVLLCLFIPQGWTI